MSLEEVARATRVPIASMERLEAGQFDELPGEVFVRGFLKSYARAVELSIKAEDVGEVGQLGGQVEEVVSQMESLRVSLDEVSGTLRSAAQELATDPASVAGAARWLVERLAVTLQASLLVRFSTRKVADAFLATRVERQGGSCLGTLPVGERTTREVVERAVAV